MKVHVVFLQDLLGSDLLIEGMALHLVHRTDYLVVHNQIQ